LRLTLALCRQAPGRIAFAVIFLGVSVSKKKQQFADELCRTDSENKCFSLICVLLADAND